MNWPADGSPLDIDDLVKPLHKALLNAYIVQRINQDANIGWTGPSLGKTSSHICLQPTEVLSAKQLTDQDALEVILTLAIQLGAEQGIRMFKKSTEYAVMEIAMKAFESAVKKGKQRKEE